MENLLETAKGIFIKDDKPNWGAIGIGAGAMLLGGWLGSNFGWLGMILGALAGVVGGSMLVEKNVIGGMFPGKADFSAVKPELSPDISQKVNVKETGVDYQIAVPKKAQALNAPWSEGDRAAYLADISDTQTQVIVQPAKLAQNPLSDEIPTDGMKTLVAQKNKKLYDYLLAVEGFGTQDNAPPSMPHVNFRLPSQLERDVRIADNISEDSWNKLSQVQKLARIDTSVNTRLVNLAENWADTVNDFRGVKLDDFSHKLNNAGPRIAAIAGGLVAGTVTGGNPLGIAAGVAAGGYLIDSSPQYVQSAMKDYYAGGDDATLKKKIQEVIDNENSYNSENGKKVAEFLGTQTKTAIERRKLMGLQKTLDETKIAFAEEAEKFTAKFQSYTDKNILQTIPANDEQSLQAAKEKAGTLPVSGLNADGKEHDGGAPGSTPAKVAKNETRANPFVAASSGPSVP